MATTSKTLSIYQRLAIAGVPLDHYESDLYAKVTPVSRGIIEDCQSDGTLKPGPVATFRSNSDGTTWYDLPFRYDPFWNGKRTIQERFAAQGFALEQTGGNCTAYVKNDGQIEEWVTVSGTHSAPSAVRDICAVAVCETGEEFSPETETATCGEILAALELGDDAYTLLFLKLHNGHHTRGTRDTPALEARVNAKMGALADALLAKRTQPKSAETLFRNHYTCYGCGNVWEDVWSAMCDDTCPKCGAKNNTPTHSDDITTEGTAT